MKNSVLFSLLLAGLALTGCNHATKSSDTAMAQPSNTATAADLTLIDQSGYPMKDSPANSTSTVASAAVETDPAPAVTDSQSITSATTSASATTSQSSSSLYGPEAPFAQDPTSSTTASTSTQVTDNTTQVADATRSNDQSVDQSKSSTDVASTITPADPTISTQVSDNTNVAAATQTPASTATTTQATPDSTSTDLESRITQWRLSAAEVEQDLSSGAIIVRTNDSIVGAPTGAVEDSVLETMVKGKLQADDDVSAAKIEVSATKGEIKLTGSGQSAAQIGRAIALSLDTQGVSKVSSDIKLEQAPQQN